MDESGGADGLSLIRKSMSNCLLNNELRISVHYLLLMKYGKGSYHE